MHMYSLFVSKSVLVVSFDLASSNRESVTRDFKIVDNGRLGRLDAYTGDLGRVR